MFVSPREAKPRLKSLAGDGSRARDAVRLAAVVGLAGETVDAGEDTGVVGLVGTGERDGLRRSEGARARNVDLSARLVELSLALLVGRVESQKLNAQEVLARRDALRDVEIRPALVLNDSVDTPLPAALIKAFVPDLEPLLAVGAGSSSIVDLGKVSLDGTLVRGSDGMVSVVRELGSADDMPKVGTDTVTSVNVDNRVGLGAGLSAGHVLVVHILYWVVVVGSTDASELTLILSVD